MSNVVIPYKDIVDKIAEQFISIHNQNYPSLKLFIEDEQMFAKEQDRDPDALYIVIHFGEAAINFDVAVCNITIEVLSLQNEIELTQEFLNVYVNQFNRKQDDNFTQLYLAPTKSLNFNQVYEGFRSLFVVSGTFIIDSNIIKLKKLYYHYSTSHSPEEIEVISYSDSSENSLNPQPYPNTNGRTKSYGSFQTFAFTVIIYPDGNKHLIKDLWKMKFREDKSYVNSTFKLSGEFNNIKDENNQSINMPIWNFKCRNADFNQRIGEIPTLVVTFTL